MPDGHPFFVKSQAARNLVGSNRIDPALLTQRYELQIEGAARVAGRDTDVLAIKPRDGLRYGYRLHLDQASGLPLKSDLIDQSGEPVEQLMFTTLVLHGDGEEKEAADQQQSATGSASGLADPAAARWQFEPRPAGFEPILYDVLRGPNGADVEHFVFSDRLSAYSIYIENEATDGLDGVTRIGAVHAAGRRVDGHQVTAVGEVPSATVEAAVAGVRASDGLLR
jgi:sigma-E factor negative regulatory protein RseB